MDTRRPRTRITKSFTFDAAHWLPEVPEDHKCRRLHGHTYEVIVGLEGELDARLGWVVDYGEVSRAVDPVIRELDHRCLNDISGLENPTAEILASWLHARLCRALPPLADITVRETPRTSAVFRPGD
jgi:6-pyruvoyltetrahydropterin/6-carboxytetrahydropterin synthase